MTIGLSFALANQDIAKLEPMIGENMSAAVSGLVITVSFEKTDRDAITAALLQAGCFELGEWIANRLPVALEAADERLSREWFEWLCGLPGVVKVDVAVVSWEAEDLQPTSGD